MHQWVLNVPYTAEYNLQEYKIRTPTFDPKILEKMDFVSIDRTPNQHSKGPCVSTANKKLTLQTLFFTHDVITSSNYVYLSLQTHQLSAISAVIGNRLTIVKLQVMVCAHVMSINISPGKGSNSKIQFQRKKAVLFQMKSSSIMQLIKASKNRTLE